MEDPYLFEQDHSHAAARAFNDLAAKGAEQRLYVPPRDVRAGGVSEDRLESALIRSPHLHMVLNFSTIDNSYGLRDAQRALPQ